MLRSLYLVIIYLSFIVLGAAAPFIFSLGYVWTDLFRPQLVAYIILPSIPVSLIMGALAFGAYILMDRRAPPPITVVFVLTVLLGIWITLTTIFVAVVPEPAWTKWDWAVKTVLFSAFIPFVIRSRVQIEAFMQVYLFAVFIHILPTGLKTIISGGGYGRELGLVGGNTGFGEGSTLATAAVMMIPVIFWLMKHNMLMPRLKIVRLGYFGMAVAALACTVGTYARTGLVGLIVVGSVMWLRSRRKIGFGVIIAAAMVFVGFLASDQWNARISTIDDYQTESSSLGRILVWKWTLQFVASKSTGRRLRFVPRQRDRLSITGWNDRRCGGPGQGFPQQLLRDAWRARLAGLDHLLRVDCQFDACSAENQKMGKAHAWHGMVW
jgi:probable O-glycosylation ligase (exosortase A-associated)